MQGSTDMAINVFNINQKSGQKSNNLSVNSQLRSLATGSFRDKFFSSLRKYKSNLDNSQKQYTDNDFIPNNTTDNADRKSVV